MEDKLQSKVFKSIMTGFFVLASHIIADCFLITNQLLFFENSEWGTTVSVAIYTAILNAIMLWLLSLRTEITVDVYDKKDESYNISIGNKPRVVSAKIEIKGNLKKINEKVTIEFPEWIDITVKGDPFLEEKSPTIYVIELSDSEIIYDFSISIKETYNAPTRAKKVKTEVTGKSLRYSKKKQELMVRYRS